MWATEFSRLIFDGTTSLVILFMYFVCKTITIIEGQVMQVGSLIYLIFMNGPRSGDVLQGTLGTPQVMACVDPKI